MNRDILDKYDATRDFSEKGFRSVCYAPFVSLYFDTLGLVRVCCQNTTYVVGNVAEQSLDEIWRGPRIRALRNALLKDNFALGCRFCEWQLDDGNYTGSFMRTFDIHPAASPDPDWPVQMEFSVSNTCNLECVMCRGEWSSSIRSRREKLPPLPKAYGDRFFEELRRYLPHLQRARFLGGEPFLAQESLRIWNMMVEMGLSIPCHVTTNGTQYNARVERILEAIPVSFAISMDGVTKETVESIRRNADYDALMENFRRFHAYAKRRGTTVGLTYCLMRLNWHEFGDYLLFADEWDCDVYVNTVTNPPDFSLYTLDPDDLAEISRKLDAQSERILPRLGRNRQVWIDELDRIRNRHQHSGDQELYFIDVQARLVDAFGHEPPRDTACPHYRMTAERAERRLAADHPGARLGRLRLDLDQVVVEVAGRDFLDLPASRSVGLPMDKIHRRLRERYGETAHVMRERQMLGFTDRTVSYTHPLRGPTLLRALSFPRYDETGAIVGTEVVAAAIEGDLPETTESLSYPFTDRAPGKAPARGDAITLARAQRLLERWSPGAEVSGLELDPEERVRAVLFGRSAFLGVGAADCVGKPHAELFARLVGRLGEKVETVRERIRPHLVDRTVSFRSAEGTTTYVRVMTFPRFDVDGRIDGLLVVASASDSLPPDRVPMTEAFDTQEEMAGVSPQDRFDESKARRRLEAWAPDDPAVRIVCDIDDFVRAIDAPALFGAPSEELIGKRIDDLQAVLAARFGSDMAVVHEEYRVDAVDRTVSFSTHGRDPTFVRVVTLARYDERGRIEGTVLLAAKRPDAGTHGEPWTEPFFEQAPEGAPFDVERGLRRLRIWSRGGPVLGAACDLGGRLKGTVGDRASQEIERCADFDQATLGGEGVSLIESKTTPWLRDRLFRADRPEGAVEYVRVLTLPRYSAKGELIGAVRLAAAARDPLRFDDRPLTESFNTRIEGKPFSPERARRRLKIWSDDRPIVGLRFDLDDVCTEVTGAADAVVRPDFLPAPGASYHDMAARLLGPEEGRAIVRAIEAADHVDRIHRFQTPPGGGAFVREIRTPLYDESGRIEGVMVQFAQCESPRDPAYLPLSDSFEERRVDRTLPLSKALRRLAVWRREGPAAGALSFDLDDVATGLASESGDFAGLETKGLVGRSNEEIGRLFAQRLGEPAGVVHEDASSEYVDRIVRFRDAAGGETLVRVIIIPRHDDAGALASTLVCAQAAPSEAIRIDRPPHRPLTESFPDRVASPGNGREGAASRGELAAWSGGLPHEIRLDLLDVAVESADREFLGVPAEEIKGQPAEAIVERLARRWGEDIELVRESIDERRIERWLLFQGRGGSRAEARILVVPEYDVEGRLTGTRLHAAITTSDPSSEPAKKCVRPAHASS